MIPYSLYVCCVGLLMCPSLTEGDLQLKKKEGNAATEYNADGKMVTFVPKYCRLLDATELEKLKMSQSVAAIFFYHQNSSNWTDEFLEAYDKSAGFLNAYGLPLGLVDCSTEGPQDVKEECSNRNSSRVYAYRFGEMVLDLDVSTMFDVDSIMSNILALALFDEMHLVESKDELLQLEHDYAGQKDLVVAYQSALGTYESRVFLEIAYAYQDKYHFVMTINISATVDLQDADLLSKESGASCVMWLLYCRERYDTDSGCRSVNYRGNVHLADLALFFKQLDWPKVMYRQEGSQEEHPCEQSNEAGCVTVYHTQATKAEVDSVIDSLQFDLHGMAGLIVQTNSKVETRDPQVIIKKPGGQAIKIEDTFELTVIENEIATHLLPSPEEETSEPVDEESVIKLDDMVLQVAFTEGLLKGDVPNVPALTDKTFPAAVKDSKLLVVLFYLPFDAPGMVFLKPFGEAGRRLAALKGEDPSAHPLVRVNCFDWTDVCQKENITSYPSVFIYRRGEKRELYRHALDTDVMVHTVMLLQAEQPLMLTTEEEVTSFMNGQLPTPAYSDVDNLVVMKLGKARKEMESYKAVVRALGTQMLFAIVGPDVETELVPSGGVLHKRTKDKIRPVDTLSENLDAASIIDFLKKGQYDFFPELTFMNFPALYARKQPFGILFYEPSVPGANDVHQTIVDLLLSGKGDHMIFCKMGVGDSNPEAKPLLLNYTQTEQLPAFTIVNHDKGEVHVLQDTEMKPTALLTWIKAVQNGEVAPSKILDKGEWKPPGQHFDFLTMMDKEKMRKHQEAKGCKETPHSEQDGGTRSALLELKRSRLYSIKNRKTHSPATNGQDAEGESTDTKRAAMETEMTDSETGQTHPDHSEL